MSDAIYKRKLTFFFTKLQPAENTMCKLFEKYVIDELESSYLSFFLFILVLFATSTMYW